jgi:LCP family protein required for cell wall assembly
MSETMREYFARQAKPSDGPVPEPPRRRKRRLMRALIVAAVSVVVLVGALAGAGYLVINHLASSIPRISGISALTAADRPVMPAATRDSMTVLLITTNAFAPTQLPGADLSGTSGQVALRSNLIALVHLNADHRSGSVVSIPPTVIVNVPGHGRMEIHRALQLGGPSLLITTVEQLTNVRIDHFSVVNFTGVGRLLNAMGGINVDVPRRVVSYGVSFGPGVNHLTSFNALAYVRQAGASSIGRVQLQQNFLRGILDRMAQIHSVGQVGTDVRVLATIGGVLSVDSDFSNSQLESLALRLRDLHGSSASFVTAPTVNGSPASGGLGSLQLNAQLSAELWQAIRHDSVAAFARQHPATVTPIDPY